jgi:hypothetical protein
MRNLAEFAEWAFGPTGFPNLAAIAYGDFSHGQRFKWSQVRLCRSSSLMTDGSVTSSPARPYRVVSPSEFRSVFDQIEGAKEMLSACQTEHAQSPWED